MRAKLVNEAIKHLSPKSKEELDAMSKKIHDEFETRKNTITKLINKLGKKFNRTPKFTTYPIFNPFDPFKKIIDFGGEIEYNKHFMFYVRTQEHLNGFELGCGTMKHQGNPIYDEWEEADNIKDVEDRIYDWYNEYVTKY